MSSKKASAAGRMSSRLLAACAFVAVMLRMLPGVLFGFSLRESEPHHIVRLAKDALEGGILRFTTAVDERTWYPSPMVPSFSQRGMAIVLAVVFRTAQLVLDPLGKMIFGKSMTIESFSVVLPPLMFAASLLFFYRTTAMKRDSDAHGKTSERAIFTGLLATAFLSIRPEL